MLRKIFFNFQYYKHPPWDTGVSPPELIRFIECHPPGRALDLGCGTGTNAIFLKEKGWDVTGVDFARRALRIARSKAKSAGVQIDFRYSDVSSVNGLSGKFDLILDIGCFHGLTPIAKSRYLSNLEHLLSEEGSFMIYAFICSPSQQGIGIEGTDLNYLTAHYHLVSREDGSERGQRASAWFIFERN
jgi:cyclopropane fatty-acyl-phospholipid synthase-like methyltransferase